VRRDDPDVSIHLHHAVGLHVSPLRQNDLIQMDHDTETAGDGVFDEKVAEPIAYGKLWIG
jgi:hypothetical protein